MQLAIEHHEEGDRAGWFITEKGARVAEMTYAREGNVLVMNHTWVDDSLRGHGVARELLDEAVRYARANGLRMRAQCPYVAGQFEKDRSLDALREP